MTWVVIDASAGVEIDAIYVALAEQLGASLPTDDHRLVQAPTFPSHVPVLRLLAGL